MKVPLRQFAFLVALSVCASSCLPVQAQDSGSPGAAQQGSLQPGERVSQASSAEITIPGPLRSFQRMAAISQKVSPDEVLPLLARNIFSQGYQGSLNAGRPTEFLILLIRYVQQARELTTLAGAEGTIRVSSCGEAQPLLRILGYRLRKDCGQPSSTLITADPDRAFLTIDSGFPLPQLEEALQGGKPFLYAYPSSQVPLLFHENDWTAALKDNPRDRSLLDLMLREPAMARLYWALARSGAETRDFLYQSPGLKKLLPSAAVLDFYGSHITIRSGRVVVPGGTSAESAWKDLVGAGPDTPAEFVPRLLAKDRGWLAAYFDALSRINQTQQAHFTEPHRLRRYYDALRGQDSPPDAARSVFRPSPCLLLLLTRLQWEPTGEPHIPGNVEVWKQILHQRGDSRIARALSKHANHINNSEQVLEAMFALSREQSEFGPLQIYLTLSDLDLRRPQDRRLTPKTVLFLAERFGKFSDQYRIFSEFPELTDASVTHFLYAAESLDRISNRTLRGNAMGIFQANVGLWQILARQGQISSAELNDSWQKVIKPFANVPSSSELVDAGRDSLRELLVASAGTASGSQDEIIDLLAGPQQAIPEAQRVHREVADGIRSVMDGQRLVPLDTLLALGDGLSEMAKGKGNGDGMIPLARELGEFEMPRPIFTGTERTIWTAGTYNVRHTELQMKTDLTKVIKAGGPPEKLAEARGQLAPFLRDTLVGLNYAYYEPPGAQMLHNNPLFVRSHDFTAETVEGVERVWQAPLLFGEGSPAAGGAHLVGSLAELPYVLATVEEDFVAPENVQALIWKELVPGLLTSAVLPRWWGVSKEELHAVTLYQRTGEEILTASSQNNQLRGKVMNILSDRMPPQRCEWLEWSMRAGRVQDALPEMMPADTFYLALEYRRRFGSETSSWGLAGQELENLSHAHAHEVSWERLSQDFGIPHPILAQSYAKELLNVEPFPSFEGYSSRLLAETWDSNNLYWARLADEMGYPPVMLNRLVPVLTRRMVEKIFATDFEDWPAILRAMRETGEEFRQGKIAGFPATGTVTHLVPPPNGQIDRSTLLDLAPQAGK